MTTDDLIVMPVERLELLRQAIRIAQFHAVELSERDPHDLRATIVREQLDRAMRLAERPPI